MLFWRLLDSIYKLSLLWNPHENGTNQKLGSVDIGDTGDTGVTGDTTSTSVLRFIFLKLLYII